MAQAGGHGALTSVLPVISQQFTVLRVTAAELKTPAKIAQWATDALYCSGFGNQFCRHFQKKLKISRWRRTGYNSSHVTSSPHPTGPACLHDPGASKSCSARVCILRGSRTAGGRPVSSRRAARSTVPTADSPSWIARNCGVRRHMHPCVSEQQRTRLCRVLLAFRVLFELPVTVCQWRTSSGAGTGAYVTNAWPKCDQSQYPNRESHARLAARAKNLQVGTRSSA
jgi:hypothetical protein